jgi:hypothetical protein
METSLRCPKCAKPLAAGAVDGLCPECLLRAGFASGTQPAPARAVFVPPTPAELAPLFPQLEILALIGQGGMGAVYRARQPSLDRVVALKILAPQAGRGPAFAERFTREARALARLSHPNIVGVHDFGTAADYHYFVMEFVDGVTLRHLLATQKTTPREALAIVPQICDALQFAHDRGIVHRDIKPENILVDRSGAVKIADFGLAKIVGGEPPDFSITGANDVMGTPYYMAPEQVEHPLDVDHRADIYSLGVVFYQMLTGELPLGRFAPPSSRIRGMQIDVRLDEIVLRALEKEPELRYQQASGLKLEVETIARTNGHVPPASADDDAAARPATRTVTTESGRQRSRWFVLILVWALAGTFLWQQARLVNQYLNTAGQLGLRGAAAADTPLQQIFPAFASDAQMWVRHAIALLEEDQLQLRHTNVDNAPHGREVHWDSAWAWCIAGAGKLHQLATGLPLPRAVERATLWLNPAVMLGLIIVLSSWAARHLGTVAGVVVVVAATCDHRIYEGFFPSYVDHHGLLTMAVFGLVLGAVVMGGGWWQQARGPAILPDAPQTARSAATFSALCGAAGMWVSAATAIPAIMIVGGSGLLAVLVQGRNAIRQGALFDAASWRIWGRVGAGASVIAYAIEYFPGHLSFRLEPNHPFHALAWLGGSELIAQIGERWLLPVEQRWKNPRTLLWPVLALSVAPLTIFLGGIRVFSVGDPFMAALHRDYIREFLPLWGTVRNFEIRALFDVLQVGSLPVLAAVVTLLYRRREAPAVIWFAAFVTAALTAMAWGHSRWLLNVMGPSIALIIVLLMYWTATFRPFVRWVVALAILGQYFVPGAVMRYIDTAKDVSAHRITPRDAANALSRDIAAALRAAQPQGEIVLLASPNASATIGYYGRIKTLGTLYWENSDGLKSAARIFSAGSEPEAERLIRAHRVTHIAIVSDESFIQQYFRLLHPDGANDQQSFGYRLMTGAATPPWLQKLPYNMPDDLKALNTTVSLFKVQAGPGTPNG